MADLSFIEDSVAFPEKEEDEEEEEEGVEWGYEEGNPPHVEGSWSQDSASEAARRVCPAQRGAGAPSASASRLPTWVSVTFPFPWQFPGSPPPEYALGSLAFLPGSAWHLPPPGGRDSLGCDISCLLSSYGEQRYLLLNSLRKQFVKL